MKAFIAVLLLSFSILTMGEEQSISPEEERARALFERTWQKVEEEFSRYDLEKPDFIFPSRGHDLDRLAGGSAYYLNGTVVLPYDYINNDDENIMSVLAHEIGHAILSDTKTQIITENPDDFTSVDSICEVYEATNIVPEHYHDLLTTLQSIQVIDNGNDYLSKVFQPRTISGMFLIIMLSQPFVEQSRECLIAKYSFINIYEKFRSCKNEATITCDQTDMEKDQIEDIYNIFLENGRVCLEGKNELLHDLVRQHPRGRLLTASDKIKLFDPNRNPVDILLELNEENLENYRAIYQLINGENIRFLSEEDEADLFLLLVMGDSSKFDLLFQSRATNDMERCVEYIEQSGEPFYGSLTEIHHSSCWRLWRNKKILEELQDPEKRELLKDVLINNNPGRAEIIDIPTRPNQEALPTE